MRDVHAKAKQGIKLLLGRQVAIQILTFGGGIVLARVLGPAQLGLYVISVFLVSTFALLGDFGLAASFVQRKKELTDRDLQVGFTLQQILTSAVVLALLLAAPKLVHLYPKAPPETVWLVRATAFNLYLTSWRTMSALQLERSLRYDRLARVEVVEALSYQGIAVGLALAGFGIWSYVVAALTQGILGTVLVYLASPWRIRFAFDQTIARNILRYGLPFQVQTLANSVGGWVTPLLIGSLIGPVGVGYLTWASSNGRKPLILTDIIMRVAFPHFSRIQDDRAEVERILTRYLTFLLLIAGFWFSLLLIAGPVVVEVLYTQKWLPGVPALILYSGALAFDMISWVVGVSLNGLGQVSFTTRVVACRTASVVALSIPLVLSAGFIGAAAAYLVGSVLTVPWLFLGLGKGAFTRILTQMSWLLVPAVGSCGLGWIGLHLSASFPILSASLPVQALLLTLLVAFAYWTLAYGSCPTWAKNMLHSRLGRWINSSPAAAEEGTVRA